MSEETKTGVDIFWPERWSAACRQIEEGLRKKLPPELFSSIVFGRADYLAEIAKKVWLDIDMPRKSVTISSCWDATASPGHPPKLLLHFGKDNFSPENRKLMLSDTVHVFGDEDICVFCSSGDMMTSDTKVAVWAIAHFFSEP